MNVMAHFFDEIAGRSCAAAGSARATAARSPPADDGLPLGGGDLLSPLGLCDVGLGHLGRLGIGDRRRPLELLPDPAALLSLPAAPPPHVPLMTHARDLLSTWAAGCSSLRRNGQVRRRSAAGGPAES